MGYLGPLRLHFAGKFKVTPPTVNNEVTNFDNASFDPALQVQGGPNWYPKGDGIFRLADCEVTSAWLGDGTQVTDDLVLGCSVRDADHKEAARMADLDPMQQLVAEIWGLEIRLCDSSGRLLLRGDFEPAAPIDFWDRAGSGAGDNGASVAYQSVLSKLEWGAVQESPMLSQLQSAAGDGLLSIKFNLDNYDMERTSPSFTYGRVVGTIGPYEPGEPRHMVRGRHLMTAGTSTSMDTFLPAGGVNFCAAVVNDERRKIYLDLGNSLPNAPHGGGAPDLSLGTLQLTGQVPQSPAIQLGQIPYQTPGDWYERTAGVVALPSDRDLSDDELAQLRESPLVLSAGPADNPTPVVSEPANGLYVRADQFVYRLNPGDTVEVDLYATRFGQPYAGARVMAFLDCLQLQGTSGLPLQVQTGTDLPIGTPVDALQFPGRVKADRRGRARLRLRAFDPGNPRGYVDGQVYGIRPALEETLAIDSGYVFNPWDFVSVRVWDEFVSDEPPTWNGSIESIFRQYANLYPVMKDTGKVDLSDYASVTAPTMRRRIASLLSRSLDDPEGMPVTRDLSRSKREAILRWLKVAPGRRPRKGRVRASARPAAARAAVARPGVAAQLSKGSKTQAGQRRLVHKQPGGLAMAQEPEAEEIVITEVDVDSLRGPLTKAAQALQDLDDGKIDFDTARVHFKNLFIWRPGG